MNIHIVLKTRARGHLHQCDNATVRGIKKLSSTGAGTDADTGTGAIDNT